jgi:hypothetical protein
MPTAVYASPALFGAISLLLGSVVLISSLDRTWLRVIAFCALIAALPMLWQTSLGLPRPAELDFAKPSGTVVSYVVDEPKSIFAWLVPDTGNPPCASSFSFEATKALQLRKAFADARKQGSEVRVESGGSRKTGGPDFYPVPLRAETLQAGTRADNE